MENVGEDEPELLKLGSRESLLIGTFDLPGNFLPKSTI
jgi:hypothetical protein